MGAWFGGAGQIQPNQIIGSSVVIGSLPSEFRMVINNIEGKTWFELDVTNADTIVIIHDGKRVEIDKKDFLQKVGLEW